MHPEICYGAMPEKPLLPTGGLGPMTDYPVDFKERVREFATQPSVERAGTTVISTLDFSAGGVVNAVRGGAIKYDGVVEAFPAGTVISVPAAADGASYFTFVFPDKTSRTFPATSSIVFDAGAVFQSSKGVTSVLNAGDAYRFNSKMESVEVYRSGAFKNFEQPMTR
jgi:hypothetical protein